MKKFLDGNNFYGPSKHVFVILDDLESFQEALRLIDTIQFKIYGVKNSKKRIYK